jgi:drug/metabolite transporter (DMT)-like permease
MPLDFEDVHSYAARRLAFHVVLSSRYSEQHSATGLAAVQVLAVGLLAAPPALFAPRAPASLEVVVVIVFTAIVTTALAFAAVMWGQRQVTATEAAVILGSSLWPGR